MLCHTTVVFTNYKDTLKFLLQFDIKNRRLFLKRAVIGGLHLHNLFIGAIINVHSRQVRLHENALLMRVEF